MMNEVCGLMWLLWYKKGICMVQSTLEVSKKIIIGCTDIVLLSESNIFCRNLRYAYGYV
jgi:hypothetical protein